MSNSTSAPSGIGFFGLLTIVFIVLKLMGYISWSWWLVFSPLFISIILVMLLFLVVALIFWLTDK